MKGADIDPLCLLLFQDGADGSCKAGEDFPLLANSFLKRLDRFPLLVNGSLERFLPFLEARNRLEYFVCVVHKI